MGTRLLRVTGAALAMAVALVVPVVATVTATSASADTVVNGCTIVSNPTPTHFTNCPNATNLATDLSGLNLSYANLAGAAFVICPTPSPTMPPCTAANLSDTNLTDADLSGAVLYDAVCFCQPAPFVQAAGADLTHANLAGADLAQTSVGLATLTGANLGGSNLTDSNIGGDLTNANLSGANLTGTTFSYTISFAGVTEYATLTNVTFTGTLVVPANQSVTATSQAGAVATWSTPAGIPGATPGSCSPAPGSTFPLFTSTVTCTVLDNSGDVATGTFQVDVTPTTQFFTRVLIPPNGASLARTQVLDAAAADPVGVTKVLFELTGGTLSHTMIATGTPTLFGWVAKWDTTSVPNGTYTLQSLATDAAANVSASTGTTVSVDNAPPTTAIGLPANNASLKGGQYLDADAAAGVMNVVYELTGGTLNHAVIATATPTIVGW
jgi:pentapeptide repeat protein